MHPDANKFNCVRLVFGISAYYSDDKFDGWNLARNSLNAVALPSTTQQEKEGHLRDFVNPMIPQEEVFVVGKRPLTEADEKELFTSKYIFIVKLR